MTKNNLNNIIFEFLYFGLTLVSNLIIRKLIVNIVGLELVGLNNVLNQVVNFLTLIEFGISYTIMYNLYKPLKDNDQIKIIQLMNTFKKTYQYITLLFIVFGVCFVPFLKYFINDYTLKLNYIILYLILLFQIAFSMFISYKT